MKELKNSELFFTPRQAAKYLNLSLSTIKNYIFSGKLKTLKTPGGHHRIKKSELMATMGEILSSTETSGMFEAESLVDTTLRTIFGLFSTLGTFGNSLRIHSERVASLSFDIAKKMGFRGDRLETIKAGALLHDIGKLSIDSRLLLKQEALSEKEYEIVKTHPEKGSQIISIQGHLKEIAEIIVQHHERPDGRGYPAQLTSDRISKAARIVSLSEAFDSMTSPYSYKTPISKDRAISEIKLNKNTQFDPEVVEAFLAII